MMMSCVVNEMQVSFFWPSEYLTSQGLHDERPLMVTSKIANYMVVQKKHGETLFY